MCKYTTLKMAGAMPQLAFVSICNYGFDLKSFCSLYNGNSTFLSLYEIQLLILVLLLIERNLLFHGISFHNTYTDSEVRSAPVT